MAQKFYQKASVQVAFISGIFMLLIAAMYIGFEYSSVNQTNQDLTTNNEMLSNDSDEAKVEIQRLETLLTPFRTIALERYTGPEQEALSKLANKIRMLEDQVKDVEKFKKIAAKHEFIALESTLRTATISRFAQICDILNQSNIVVNISHERWVSPSTREFAKQLAVMMEEADLTISGPTASSAFLSLPREVYPIEWVPHESQFGMPEHLYYALSPIMSYTKCSRRLLNTKGKVRIHFAGNAVFEPDGKVGIQ